MSNEKTLATATHGGCVQLGDWLPPLPKAGYVTGGDFGHEAHNAFTPEQMRDYARAALSAQPSPGGQDAMPAQSAWLLPDDARIVGVIADNIEQGKLDHPGFYRNTQLAEVLRRMLTAALAARQPVGVDAATLRVLSDRWANDRNYTGSPVDDIRALIDEPTPSRQPVGELNLPPDGYYKIVYDDAQVPDESFARTGALDAALRRFEQISERWNAHLFVRFANNTRDCTVPNATPAQAVDLERARNEGHDGAIRYVLGYLCGMGDWGSTQYVEILNGCGRESIIRSAIEDGELEFTGLGRWVAERGTDEERALIASQAVRNG
ncbi:MULTISPECIES: hypothetical protein [Stenotrophomonas]|uniref:hypothetical protein n=1 Tax=Stenotrophomonas TaxID=40323 RepID=UPI000B65CC5C|nr:MULTISPECIES: hypothetical protein [Stenotrophomonas]SMR69331.1 hypothetical protein SAMN04487863_0299 [Stenotrophomonas sp. yr243]SNT57798.1 hypothetical protein SAMN05518671_3614 [Stenotrophomonas lactitubi]